MAYQVIQVLHSSSIWTVCWACLKLSFGQIYLLRPWLVPSSGVTGIADDLIPPWCPVSCVVPFQPRLFHISLTRIFPLMFGRSLLLFPGMSTSSTLLTVCPSFILLTRPYHLSRFSVIFFGRLHHSCCPSNMYISDLIPSCHVHLSIFISFSCGQIYVFASSTWPKCLSSCSHLVKFRWSYIYISVGTIHQCIDVSRYLSRDSYRDLQVSRYLKTLFFVV